MEKITELKIVRENMKDKKNNNNNSNNKYKYEIIMTIIKKELNLFHFDSYALTTTFLPRKLVRNIFGSQDMLLYSQRELICYH